MVRIGVPPAECTGSSERLHFEPPGRAASRYLDNRRYTPSVPGYAERRPSGYRTHGVYSTPDSFVTYLVSLACWMGVRCLDKV